MKKAWFFRVSVDSCGPSQYHWLIRMVLSTHTTSPTEGRRPYGLVLHPLLPGRWESVFEGTFLKNGLVVVRNDREWQVEPEGIRPVGGHETLLGVYRRGGDREAAACAQRPHTLMSINSARCVRIELA